MYSLGVGVHIKSDIPDNNLVFFKTVTHPGRTNQKTIHKKPQPGSKMLSQEKKVKH